MKMVVSILVCNYIGCFFNILHSSSVCLIFSEYIEFFTNIKNDAFKYAGPFFSIYLVFLYILEIDYFILLRCPKWDNKIQYIEENQILTVLFMQVLESLFCICVSNIPF